MKIRTCCGLCLVLLALLTGCVYEPAPPPVTPTPTSVPPIPSVTPFQPATHTPAPVPSITPSPSPTPTPAIPRFDHIVVVVLENKEFGTVIGNSQMPFFNRLGEQYTLLTQYYAITHPSLPNYLALIAGDTFGIARDCTDCWINAPSLPDQMESAEITWKTYQESMPAPCFIGNHWPYAQKHNPFISFDAIRNNTDRCNEHIVPYTQLFLDITKQSLPNFIFITPNECHDAHDCGLSQADAWLQSFLEMLQPALEAESDRWLIIVTWDEGQGDHSCCNLSPQAGGRVATVLISPLVRNHFQDPTPYTHYSLLKTIATSWGLPTLGQAARADTPLILSPWKETTPKP